MLVSWNVILRTQVRVLALLGLPVRSLLLHMLDVVADLFGQQRSQLWTDLVFCIKVKRELHRIITLANPDILILTWANLDRERQYFLPRVPPELIQVTWKAQLLKELLMLLLLVLLGPRVHELLLVLILQLLLLLLVD